MIRVGPFILEEPIGRGGMAEVWGAVHEREGARAAVKILTGEAILNPIYLSLFRNEVRGIAGLEHPNIVKVFDHGLLTPEAAEASGGSLQAGSPWLAMERLDGGTLSDYARDGTDWPSLSRALLATLDGLAHAHARGVVHRDIKPGNVLLGTDGEIKLTDFGLVHAIAAVDEVGDSMLLGTPAYMAPEQLTMRSRDFGPWTDLYAVGCTAWALATGQPPFGRELQDALRGHLHERPPQFTPDLRLPQDFEPWLRWLLIKPVEQRVSRAAEAADALAALGGTPRPGWHRGWRRAERPERAERAEQVVSRPLHGVGLGMIGVQSVPLVGREKEQDFLWRELTAVDREGSPRAVLIHGGAGYGKTRLAHWLAERAHELGAAELMHARWSAAGGAALVDMLRRDLACDGLQRPEVQMRVKLVLKRLGETDAGERATLTELLCPMDFSHLDHDELGGTRREPLPERVRRRLIVNHLRRRSLRRPLVLLLDQIQWGFDGLMLVRALLTEPEAQRIPVLILCTVRDEALSEQPATRIEIGKMAEQPAVSSLHLGPLSRRTHERFVEGMLGLEAGLASRVQRRTMGNPGFTLALVTDWIQKGLLELSPEGYRLKPGVEAPMPLALYETWWLRIERALRDRPDQDAEALELAALLGVVVRPQEWRDVARAVDLRTPPTLVKKLIEQKLVIAKDGDANQPWSFSQPMLRAALVRRAQEQGRSLRLHQECARVLSSKGSGSLERVGLHLLAASLPDEALPPLTRAARHRLLAGDFPRAEELIQSRRDALDLLVMDDRDRDIIEQRLLEAELARRTARLPRALAKADQAARLVRETNTLDLLDNALLEQASALLAHGDLGEARGAYEEALRLATEQDDREMIALAQRGLAETFLRLGQFHAAVKAGRSGVTAAQVFAEPLGLAEARLRLADALMSVGDLPEALECLRRARRAFQHLGARAGLAESLAMMGTLAMRQNSYDRAEQCFRKAEAQLDDLGATTAPLWAVRRAFAFLEMGQPTEARADIEGTRNLADARALRLVLAMVTAAQMEIGAETGDRERVRRAWERGRPIFGATGLADLDSARAMTRAAKATLNQGWDAEAVRIAALAVIQWEALGRGDSKDAARLRALAKRPLQSSVPAAPAPTPPPPEALQDEPTTRLARERPKLAPEEQTEGEPIAQPEPGGDG